MAPWTSGGGGSGGLSEVLPLVPMRATLLPVVAGYPVEEAPCSVLDLVFSGSLCGVDVAELRERSATIVARCSCFAHSLEVSGYAVLIVC